MSRTIAKYTLDGDSVRAISFPLISASISLYDIAVDSAGQFFYVTGAFAGSVDFGDGIVIDNNKLGNFDLYSL